MARFPDDREIIIEFLVRRKFPAVTLATLPPGSQAKRATTIGRFMRHEEMKRFREELEGLPPEKIASMYGIEQAKLVEEARIEEQSRFFNQPHAAADFDHWSKAEHWSIEEAVALAMGKAPEVVHWSNIQSYGQVSPFVQKYGRLRDLAQRAVPWKKLYDPVLPTIFLKWAEDNEIAIPAELRERVFKLKGNAADWKKNYDELFATYDQQTTKWKNLVEQQAGAIDSLHQKITELRSELAEHKAGSVASKTTKAQSPIERENMLKVIYGMAVGGYGYKTDEKRSAVVAEIVSDLNLQGTPLSDDTIRRYLNEARDNLPEWQ